MRGTMVSFVPLSASFAGLTDLAGSQASAEGAGLESLAEMYNSGKFRWVHLSPGTDTFVVKGGSVDNFDVSGLTPQQRAIFLGTPPMVAGKGVRVRTLYVWESDSDRRVYIYNESGEVLASYPPPDGYDPYVLAREEMERQTNLTEERCQELMKWLDPSRVMLSVDVADGALSSSTAGGVTTCSAPPLPEPPAGPPPGGPGAPAESGPLSNAVATWSDEQGLELTFNNPGLDTRIPIWKCDGPSFDPLSYAWDDKVESDHSDVESWQDENSAGSTSRYYYAPFLDTTYVQEPSSDSLTVKYVAARNVTATAWVWKPGGWDQAVTKPADQVPDGGLGSEIYLYQATFTDEDFQGNDPDHVEANTIYRYRFTWSGGHTATQTTRTWPEQENITDFSFIVYGDNRGDNNHDFREPHRNVACLGILRRGCIFEGVVEGEPVNEYPTFILHTGDLVHDGIDPEQWIPHFFRPAGALISRLPGFPSLGNHEHNGWDHKFDPDARQLYLELFNLPENATVEADKGRYYSFDYGNCHFVVLDTAYDSRPGIPEDQRDDFFEEDSDQHDWLCQDLEASSAKWKIVVMHVPAYTQSSDGHGFNAGDVKAVRRELAEKVFNKAQYGVKLVFSGHNHFYERSRVPRGEGGYVYHMVTGGGGAPPHEPTGGDPNEFRVKAESVSHYCRVRLIEGGARLKFEALRLDGSQIDSFSLK